MSVYQIFYDSQSNNNLLLEGFWILIFWDFRKLHLLSEKASKNLIDVGTPYSLE